MSFVLGEVCVRLPEGRLRLRAHGDQGGTADMQRNPPADVLLRLHDGQGRRLILCGCLPGGRVSPCAQESSGAGPLPGQRRRSVGRVSIPPRSSCPAWWAPRAWEGSSRASGRQPVRVGRCGWPGGPRPAQRERRPVRSPTGWTARLPEHRVPRPRRRPRSGRVRPADHHQQRDPASPCEGAPARLGGRVGRRRRLRHLELLRSGRRGDGRLGSPRHVSVSSRSRLRGPRLRGSAAGRGTQLSVPRQAGTHQRRPGPHRPGGTQATAGHPRST